MRGAAPRRPPQIVLGPNVSLLLHFFILLLALQEKVRVQPLRSDRRRSYKSHICLRNPLALARTAAAVAQHAAKTSVSVADIHPSVFWITILPI